MTARAAALGLAIAALAALQGCNRNEAPLTPCVGNAPAAPRVTDAGPPNCTPLIPGSPAPAAPPLG